MSAMPFEQLYRRHNSDLLRYARRLTRNAAVAEDLAQQAWTQFLHANHRGAPWPEAETELRALLFAVARNAFIDTYRRAHFETRTVRLDARKLDCVAAADSHAGPPETEAHREGVARMLQRALSCLPRAQRDAVSLWQRGLDIRTMARCAGVPRDTFLSRKKYAFARLRQSVLEAGLNAETC